VINELSHFDDQRMIGPKMVSTAIAVSRMKSDTLSATLRRVSLGFGIGGRLPGERKCERVTVQRNAHMTMANKPVRKTTHVMVTQMMRSLPFMVAVGVREVPAGCCRSSLQPASYVAACQGVCGVVQVRAASNPNHADVRSSCSGERSNYELGGRPGACPVPGRPHGIHRHPGWGHQRRRNHAVTNCGDGLLFRASATKIADK
jgi:hypothetical protein